MKLFKKNILEDYQAKLDSLINHMKNTGFLSDGNVESIMRKVQ